jgi:hypothetical protein
MNSMDDPLSAVEVPRRVEELLKAGASWRSIRRLTGANNHLISRVRRDLDQAEANGNASAPHEPVPASLARARTAPDDTTPTLPARSSPAIGGAEPGADPERSSPDGAEDMPMRLDPAEALLLEAQEAVAAEEPESRPESPGLALLGLGVLAATALWLLRRRPARAPAVWTDDLGTRLPVNHA